MIKNIKLINCRLRRVHSKLGEIITWDVLSLDKKIRIGVIRQVNDPWAKKRLGWQEFPVKYWIGTKFWPVTSHYVGEIRTGVLRNMLEK